jgi:hypothetical protein
MGAMNDRSEAYAAGTAICERVMRLVGELSPAGARALLKLRFPPPDVERMQALSAKARAATLTAHEQAEMDAYEQLGCLLDMLHSKARRTLNKRRSAS